MDKTKTLTLKEMGLKGQKISGVRIIDAHTHLGSYANYGIHPVTPESMLEVMDRVGVEKAVISSFMALGPDMVRGNNQVLEVLDKYPDRFLGYVVINPHYGDKIKSELDRCLAHPLMRGLKLHPAFHHSSLKKGDYDTVLAYANEKKMLVLNHDWGTFNELAFLTEKYADIKYLVAHCGIGVKATDLQIIKSLNNIYLDLSFSAFPFGVLEKLCESIGAHRITFSSDFVYLNLASQIGRVLLAHISEAEKKQILGANMAKLLGI